MSSQDSDSPSVEEQVTPEDVVDLFDELKIPFVTSKMVAREYNCTGQTARNKLSILVDEGDLERIDLGGRQAV
jgi:ribosomal protein S25